MKQQVILTIEIEDEDLGINIVFEPGIMGEKDFGKASDDQKVIQNVAMKIAEAVTKQLK